MAESRSLRIAMWGPSGVGKTMFLAQIYHQKAVEPTPWTLQITEKAKEFVNNTRDDIEGRSRFPAATAIDAQKEVVYRFFRDGNPPILLSVEDRPGLDWMELKATVHEQLHAADAFLMLVKPNADAGLRIQIQRTAELLLDKRPAPRDPRPVAVCLSHADILMKNAADVVRARENPHEFAREHISDRIYQTVSDSFSTFQLFPVSSVGVRLRYGVLEPAVFYDEDLELRLRPGDTALNLMAPLVWLFEQLRERL